MNDTPDGEKTAEMACTCVFALCAAVIALSVVIMYLIHHVH